jgi:SAM-dependent methyltransferase
MSDGPLVTPGEVAGAFGLPSVAAAYRHRLPYPPAVFDVLAGLVTDEPRAVLDIGCGTGNIARPLAPRVDRVDAVDVSAAMIEQGKRLPGGDHPRIQWIVGRAEDAPLRPPYALVTAGGSLHWMDWEVVLPRLRDALTAGGVLALLSANRESEGASWERALAELVQRYRTSERWSPDMLPELERRRLFRVQGRAKVAPILFRQSANEYVEALHSQSTLARERMGPDRGAAFDDAARRLLMEQVGEVVWSRVSGEVLWGKPMRS